MRVGSAALTIAVLIGLSGPVAAMGGDGMANTAPKASKADLIVIAKKCKCNPHAPPHSCQQNACDRKQRERG